MVSFYESTTVAVVLVRLWLSKVITTVTFAWWSHHLLELLRVRHRRWTEAIPRRKPFDLRPKRVFATHPQEEPAKDERVCP